MYYIGIEAFLAIVRSGSISKAADTLHLSQSTVSYRLKTLEDELGFKLISRQQGVRGIGLTQQGHRYINISEQLIELRKQTKYIKETQNHIDFTIGAADSISQYLLPALYKNLWQDFPTLKPRIITQHTMETYESIQNNSIDIGFVKRAYNMPNVIVKQIIDEEMVLVRYGDPGQFSHPLSPKDLNSKMELYMDWGVTYQSWHDYWFNVKDYAIRVDAASLIFDLFKDDSYWSIVPKSVFKHLRTKGPFVEQKLTAPPPNRQCYLVANKYGDREKHHIHQYINKHFSL